MCRGSELWSPGGTGLCALKSQKAAEPLKPRTTDGRRGRAWGLFLLLCLLFTLLSRAARVRAGGRERDRSSRCPHKTAPLPSPQPRNQNMQLSIQ